MNDIAEHHAHSAIRAVLARYVRGVDRLDADLIRSCYHPDAYEVHGVFNGNAHEFATWRVRQTFRSHHVLSESAIRLDGDRAFVETPHAAVVHVDLDTPEHSGIIEARSSGWYLDVFTREDDRWLIKHRVVNTFARSERLIVAATQPDATEGARLSALEFDLPSAAPAPSSVPDVAEAMRRRFLSARAGDSH
ncbi:nuclear transport factor 2 family protein [Nocardioides sp. Soil796]|uniref:nuclear transport factor 2 family protein n=1 Tax=Nocardioides sp. Soil796 TaxID=1736412 RepID=UPI00071119DC|nr:nuclear transport factor 2 family protein [Nocardioides sp. Soil796]KRF10454.1 hypothetical protein ASH02_20330 [Nocardioides sp. Soil796]